MGTVTRGTRGPRGDSHCGSSPRDHWGTVTLVLRAETGDSHRVWSGDSHRGFFLLQVNRQSISPRGSGDRHEEALEACESGDVRADRHELTLESRGSGDRHVLSVHSEWLRGTTIRFSLPERSGRSLYYSVPTSGAIGALALRFRGPADGKVDLPRRSGDTENHSPRPPNQIKSVTHVSK